MATLIKPRDKYYARITKWDNVLKKKTLVADIPLLTDSKMNAKAKLIKVNEKENLIKQNKIVNIDLEFPWLNKRGTTDGKSPLVDATEDWIDSREKRPNLRRRTIEINKNAVKHMISAWGKKIPISEITPKHISSFIEVYAKRKNLSVTTININLRSINTFFKWLVSQDFISKVPQVNQLRVDEPDVKYLSEYDISKLYRSDLSIKDNQRRYIKDWEHYKKAFSMYINTGMRRVEPFLGTINGYWLDIPASESKTHKKRMIRLNDEHIKIIQEMRDRVDSRKNKMNGILSYTNMFRRARKMLGLNNDLTLHSLRHTYGCIRRLETNGNIIQIRDEMGHKNISTTERYCNIPIQRLEDDFPSYVNSEQNSQLVQHIGTTNQIDYSKD